MTLPIARVLLFVLILAPPSALATTFTFSTSDSPFDPGVGNQGWYPTSGPNTDTNDNYFVGTTVSGQTLRNFFTFDLAPLPAGFAVLSATLRLMRFATNNDEVETIELFDVSTGAATLNNNIGANAAIYDDLGSGTSYGAFQVAVEPIGAGILEFSLNGAALVDIASAAGGFFSIGGALISDDGDDDLFAGSSSVGVQELVVVAVPEPTTAVLLLLGLLGFARSRCRHA